MNTQLQPPPADHPAWEKVRKMYERGDFDTIDQMVETYEAVMAVGRVGAVLRRMIIWLGGMFLAWFAFSDWFKTLIKTIAGGH